MSSSKHTKIMAIIFTESEQKIFEEYRDTFNFGNSANAYRGLIDLVEKKWTGVRLKNDSRFHIRLTLEDYETLEKIGESLGGISKSETLRRGVDFLYNVTFDKNELAKWKKFAAEIPRYERTGKKKAAPLSEGKMVIYSMNDIRKQAMEDICKAFGESRTDVLRIALGVLKTLPPETFIKPKEKKFHSTVRLNLDECERLEVLKERLRYNGAGVFRTGIFLAKKELRMLKMNNRKQLEHISIDSDIWDPDVFEAVCNTKQNVILKP